MTPTDSINLHEPLSEFDANLEDAIDAGGLLEDCLEQPEWSWNKVIDLPDLALAGQRAREDAREANASVVGLPPAQVRADEDAQEANDLDVAPVVDAFAFRPSSFLPHVSAGAHGPWVPKSGTVTAAKTVIKTISSDTVQVGPSFNGAPPGVGRGGATPSVNRLKVIENLIVHGEALKSGGSTQWLILSDARIKEVLCTFDQGLGCIVSFVPRLFRYKNQPAHERPYAGVIAQELPPALVPYCRSRLATGGGEFLYIVDLSCLQFVLVNSLKALHEQLATSEDRVASTSADVRRISSMLRQNSLVRINYSVGLFSLTFQDPLVAAAHKAFRLPVLKRNLRRVVAVVVLCLCPVALYLAIRDYGAGFYFTTDYYTDNPVAFKTGFPLVALLLCTPLYTRHHVALAHFAFLWKAVDVPLAAVYYVQMGCLLRKPGAECDYGSPMAGFASLQLPTVQDRLRWFHSWAMVLPLIGGFMEIYWPFNFVVCVLVDALLLDVTFGGDRWTGSKFPPDAKGETRFITTFLAVASYTVSLVLAYYIQLARMQSFAAMYSTARAEQAIHDAQNDNASTQPARDAASRDPRDPRDRVSDRLMANPSTSLITSRLPRQRCIRTVGFSD